MATTEIRYTAASDLRIKGSTGAGPGIRNHRFARNFLLFVDFVLVLISALIGWSVRFIVWNTGNWPWMNQNARFKDHFAFLILYAVLFILFSYVRKLYARPRSKQIAAEISDVLKAAASASIAVTSAIYISGQKHVSREVILVTFGLSAALVVSWRLLLRFQGLSGVTEQRNIIIVGAGQVGRALHDYLERNSHLGMAAKGFIDRRFGPRYEDPVDACGGVCFLGDVSSIEAIARSHFIDEILVTLPADRNLVKEIALQAKRAGVDVRVVPDLYDGMAFGAPVEFIGEFPTMALYQQPIPALQLVLKRGTDVIVSAIALITLAPLLAVVAVMIKLDSRGPVFYNSTRIGKKGKTFTCYKFRTMVVDAESQKRHLKHLNERDGVLFKIANDPRITRLGKILRKFSIDELPQLWNVFKGDMSLVGPRPPVPGEYSKYELEHLRRLEVVPGITGLWQVEARQSPRFEDYVNLDIQYIDSWSLRLDFKLLWKTVRVVLAGTGQ